MKKGFTLIELLAVIVILAIIALIATPIILGIINDAREESNKRSVELYAKAISNGIAAHQLRTGEEVLPGTYTTLPFKVEYEGKVECRSVIISEDITVSLDKCKVNNGTKEYSYGIETGNSVLSFSDVCTYQKNGVAEKTAGAEYKCKVKDVMEKKYEDGYTFYVLNTINASGEIITNESTDKEVVSINLIMDQNIYSDGTPAGLDTVAKTADPTKYSLVEWVNKDDYGTLIPYDGNYCWDEKGCPANYKGPITAIKFLYNATKDWTNVPPLTYTYNDKDRHLATEEYGYTSFVASDGVVTLTPLTGTTTKIGTKEEPLRARLPMPTLSLEGNLYKGDIESIKQDKSNAYLFDNLSIDEYGNAGPLAYWTLSSDPYTYNFAQHVLFDGHIGTIAGNVAYGEARGVRPVINLSI